MKTAQYLNNHYLLLFKRLPQSNATVNLIYLILKFHWIALVGSKPNKFNYPWFGIMFLFTDDNAPGMCWDFLSSHNSKYNANISGHQQNNFQTFEIIVE